MIDPSNNDVEDTACHDSDVDRLHRVRYQQFILYMICYYYLIQFFSNNIILTLQFILHFLNIQS
jgi:hypothetical protein